MKLNEDQLQELNRRGFLKVEGLLSPESVEAMKKEVAGLDERMADQPHPEAGISWEDIAGTKRIRQLMNSEKVCPSIETLLQDGPLLDVVESVLGGNVSLYHSKLMMKAARVGSPIPWHQDYAYWKDDAKKPCQLNVMLYLDESTAENGNLCFVEGSHAALEEHAFFKTSSFQVGLDRDYCAEEVVAVPAKPGDAILFGSLVIHGSAGNLSAKSRRANTFAFDVLGNKHNPDHEGRVLICKGERLHKHLV